MDPACCRAPGACRSPGSEGPEPGAVPKSQAWLGVHHCIWLPKGQNSLEAPSPIWPTSDGLKLSSDLKLLVIWNLFLKKTSEEAWYLSGDLLPFLLSCVPPTTGTGVGETGNPYVIFAPATAFLAILSKLHQKQDHQLEFSWLKGLQSHVASSWGRSGRPRSYVSLR